MLDAFSVWYRAGDDWVELTNPAELDSWSDPGTFEVLVMARGAFPDEPQAVSRAIQAQLDPRAHGGRDLTMSDQGPGTEELAKVRLCALANSGAKGQEAITGALVTQALWAKVPMTAAQLQVAMAAPIFRTVLSDPGVSEWDRNSVMGIIAGHAAARQARRWAHDDDRDIVSIVTSAQADVGTLAGHLQGEDRVVALATNWCPDRTALAAATALAYPNQGTQALDVKHTEGVGLPALWEKGGSYTSSGSAQIIARPDGSRPYAALRRTRGNRACSDHALVPIADGYYIINAWGGRGGNKTVTVQRVSGIQARDLDGLNFDIRADCADVGTFEEPGWRDRVPPCLHAAVAAAIAKCSEYHCRDAYWVTDTKPQDELARPRGTARGTPIQRAERFAAQQAKAQQALAAAQAALADIPGATKVAELRNKGLWINDLNPAISDAWPSGQNLAYSDENIAAIAERATAIRKTWDAIEAQRGRIDDIIARAEAVGLDTTLDYLGFRAGTFTIGVDAVEEAVVAREALRAQEQANATQQQELAARGAAVGVAVPEAIDDKALAKWEESVAEAEAKAAWQASRAAELASLAARARAQDYSVPVDALSNDDALDSWTRNVDKRDANVPRLAALADRAAEADIELPKYAGDLQLARLEEQVDLYFSRKERDRRRDTRAAQLAESGTIGEYSCDVSGTRLTQNGYVAAATGDMVDPDYSGRRGKTWYKLAPDDLVVNVEGHSHDDPLLVTLGADTGSAPAWTDAQIDSVLDWVDEQFSRPGPRRVVPLVAADDLADRVAHRSAARPELSEAVRFATLPSSRRAELVAQVAQLADIAPSDVIVGDLDFVNLAGGVYLDEDAARNWAGGEATLYYQNRDTELAWGPHDLGDAVAVGVRFGKWGRDNNVVLLVPPGTPLNTTEDSRYAGA